MSRLTTVTYPHPLPSSTGPTLGGTHRKPSSLSLLLLALTHRKLFKQQRCSIPDGRTFIRRPFAYFVRANRDLLSAFI